MITPQTVKEWCKATGWPEAEWWALEVPEAAEILAYYGLSPSNVLTYFDRGYRAGYEDACDAMEYGLRQ